MMWTILLLFTMTFGSFESLLANPVAAAALFPPPKKEFIYPVAIIGGGAGGTMATKRMVLNNQSAILFIGDKQAMKRSRGHWVRTVDNIPGLEKYTRTLVDLREEVLNTIAKGPFKHNLSVVESSVVSLAKKGNVFELRDATGSVYLAQHIILATGMMDEQPHIGGSIRPILPYANKQTIAYCILCDGHRSYQKQAVVIGHSEEAAKSALLLAHRYQPKRITLLTNGTAPTFTKETEKALHAKSIEIIEEPIHQILGPEKGILSGFEFQSGKKITAEIGFVSLGIRPNNQLAVAVGATLDERGLVVTDSYGESSVPNLFVIGDLRANGLKQIYTAWQHAVDACQVIDRRIRDSKQQ